MKNPANQEEIALDDDSTHEMEANHPIKDFFVRKEVVADNDCPAESEGTEENTIKEIFLKDETPKPTKNVFKDFFLKEKSDPRQDQDTDESDDSEECCP